jgi:hypothetical protein
MLSQRSYSATVQNLIRNSSKLVCWRFRPFRTARAAHNNRHTDCRSPTRICDLLHADRLMYTWSSVCLHRIQSAKNEQPSAIKTRLKLTVAVRPHFYREPLVSFVSQCVMATAIKPRRKSDVSSPLSVEMPVVVAFDTVLSIAAVTFASSVRHDIVRQTTTRTSRANRP